MPLPHPTPGLCALAVVLSACAPVGRSAVQSLPPNPAPQTAELAQIKDALDQLHPVKSASQAPAPMLTGLGFAQVSGQPGKTPNEKRLMAIRAARIEAMRDLTEQVHGIRLDGQSTLRDAVLVDDRLTAVVAGSLRGARTLRITPRDQDSYEVQMALDRDTVAYILRAVKGGL